MGIVLEAWHVDLEQRVALKFLSLEGADRDAMARFRNEARALARIRNEHVARIVDIAVLDDGSPYMVMEYLEGRDLAAELRERPTLPVAESIDYSMQAIEGNA